MHRGAESELATGLLEAKVAVFAPLGAPGVLGEEVGHAGLDARADEEDLVVDARRRAIRDNAGLVALEAGRVDAKGRGPVVDQRGEQRRPGLVGVVARTHASRDDERDGRSGAQTLAWIAGVGVRVHRGDAALVLRDDPVVGRVLD